MVRPDSRYIKRAKKMALRGAVRLIEGMGYFPIVRR
jgi:hypothetical protein